jgi:uncharacterized membrane protein
MIFYLKCVALPPLVASRYTCGTRSTAPLTILWLASVVTIIFGLNGGPTAQDDVSVETLTAGILMWLGAGIWTIAATRNLEACRPDKRSKH